MECLVGFVKFPATSSLVYHSSKPKRNFVGGFRAKLHNNQSDPLLKAATRAALLRFHESRRPEPLFIDPYAGCFVNSDVDLDLEDSRHYCVATKFIDDKLLNTLNSLDGLKQVVLLTDGMDTRPYRLKWPVSTIIFDVSSERVFKTSVETLEGVGAKIPRGCLFHHVSIETPNLEHSLRTKGFNGNQSSVWAIQGLPIMTLANLEEILSVISGLAAKGCLVFGELPAWLARTEISINLNAKDWLDKLFMSNGFRVGATSYDEVAKSIGNELLSEDYKNLLFVAEQLRLSNDQMETWRREFQRIEEEGDEEGFEEL